MKAGAGRMVAYVDEALHVEGLGYRVVIVTEGESGYRPTGTWPLDGKEHVDGVGVIRPWFWGPTLEDAEAAARSYNERRGISEAVEHEIIRGSMVGSRP